MYLLSGAHCWACALKLTRIKKKEQQKNIKNLSTANIVKTFKSYTCTKLSTDKRQQKAFIALWLFFFFYWHILYINNNNDKNNFQWMQLLKEANVNLVLLLLLFMVYAYFHIF